MKDLWIPLLISSLAGLSTVIGGLIVFIKFKDKESFISFALSFSLSVMMSLSIFELIPESIIKLTNEYGFAWACILGLAVFTLGRIIVIKLNNKITLLSKNNSLYRVGVLSMIALMLHNFPEGIATFMTAYTDLSMGISLGIAIMLHNIPEGISISVPIYYATKNKTKGIIYSFISGLAEPLGAILTYLIFKNFISDITISIVLIFVAGIMITLAIEEMLPETNKYNKKLANNIGLIMGIILVLINLIIF
jgi:ZIP family zinc transporter